LLRIQNKFESYNASVTQQELELALANAMNKLPNTAIDYLANVSLFPRCRTNPFLGYLSDEDFIKYELIALQRKLATNQLIRQYRSLGRTTWEVLIRPNPLCENHLLKIGTGDGGKITCGLDLMDETNCTVISLGSRGEWDFEVAFLGKKKGCRTITFDCTGNWAPPASIQDRATFQHYCYGVANKDVATVEGEFVPARTIHQMMLDNGVEHLAFLKMDVEQAEWGYFFDMFENTPLNASRHLPYQICVELHWLFPWGNNAIIPIEKFAALMDNLYDFGYRVVSREQNVYANEVWEITLLRVRC